MWFSNQTSTTESAFYAGLIKLYYSFILKERRKTYDLHVIT